MEPPRTIQTPRGTILELSLTKHDHDQLTSATAEGFLNTVSCTPIDFAQTVLPAYQPYFAVVLDNVFSPAECAVIRALAEGHWTPLVQGNAFREVDRTLVLNSQISDVLYARIHPCLEKLGVTRLRKASKESSCHTANGPSTGVQEEGALRDWSEGIAGASNLKASRGRHKATWEMYAANERLSFLRYGPGMHHDRHCDQIFSRPEMDKEDKSFLTCQVYLSDSLGDAEPGKEEAGDRDVSDLAAAAAKGGTTRFWGSLGSPHEDRFVDVVPKVGRVLVFQQRMLWHSGQPVTEGLKYAMRTDLMYRRSFT